MLKSMISNVSAGLASGGTVDGDLTITGDFKVEGGGSFAYDEILEGKMIIKSDATSSFVLAVQDTGGGNIAGIYRSSLGDSIIYGYNASHTEKFRLNSNGATHFTGGSVGIGTSSPSDKLHIADTGTDSDGRIKSSSQNVTSSIGSAEGDNRYFTAGAGLEIMTNTNHDIRFGTNVTSGNATPQMVLDTSGRLGLGTSSPSQLLHIEGSSFPTALITGGSSTGASLHLKGINNSSVQFDDNSGTKWYLRYQPGANKIDFLNAGLSSSALTILDSNNNIGIGTDSPSANLHIKHSTANEYTTVRIDQGTSQYNARLWLGGLLGANADYVIGEIGGIWDVNSVVAPVSVIRFETGDDHVNKDDGRITFWTSSASRSLSERMRIEPDGSVGIGTSSPAANSKLHVVDGAGTMPTTHAGDSLIVQNNANTTDVSAIYAIAGTAGSSHIVFGDADSKNPGRVSYYHDSDYMSFHTNTTEQMRITSAGLIGIGETGPTQGLTLGSGKNLKLTGGIVYGVSQFNRNANNQSTIIYGGNNSNANQDARIELYGQNSNFGKALINYGYSTASKLQFQVNGNDKIVFSGAGDVGIGTDPESGVALHIKSTTNQEPIIKLEQAENHALAGQLIFLTSGIANNNDDSGVIRFKGMNDAGTPEEIEYATIYVNHDDVSDGTEDATMFFRTQGSGSLENRLVLDGNSRISLSNNDDGTDNTVFGYKAALNIDSGSDYNVYIGHETAGNGTHDDAVMNTAVGYRAMYPLTSGDYNTALGSDSLRNITTGSSNTAIGSQSLYSVSTGFMNIGLGRESLKSLDTGTINIAIGNNALYSETGGDTSLAIGSSALYSQNMGAGSGTDSKNVGIGYLASYYNVTGTANVSIGYEAMKGVSSNSHSNNIAIGFQAGYDITTGSNNVLLGTQAGDNASTLGSSIGIGYQSLGGANSTLLTGANATIAIGYQALGNLSGNAGNGVYIGYLAGKDDINGGNTAIGYRAMETSQGTNMTKNTAIGVLAQQNISFNGSANNTSLGYNALKGGSITAAIQNNVAIGMGALSSVTSTYGNVAIGGRSALGSLTSGNSNIAIGDGAGQTMTTTTSCILIGSSAGNVINSTDANGTVGIGHSALVALTSGQYNTAIGYEALKTEDTGNFCTAIGYQALRTQNRDGTVSNTAVGYKAGYAVTDAYEATLIGSNAGKAITTGFANTIIGANTADSLTTGDHNTAVGALALNSEDVGRGTTAIGYQALYSQNSDSNDEDTNNVGVGFHAGYYNVTGVACTFVGGRSGVGSSGNDIGNFNTGFGSYALNAITTGVGNVGIGANALMKANHADADYNVAVGYGAGSEILNGYYNILIGYNSGNTLTSGGENTIIGHNCDVASGDNNNNIIIGNNLTASDNDNRVYIGNDSSYIFNDFNTNATWTHSSDERQKKEIKDDTLGLDFINDIRPVTYKHKSPSEFPKEWNAYDENNKEPMGGDKVIHGLIAQEVKQALDKQGIDTFSGWGEEDDGRQQVSFEAFVLPLIKAVQELSAEVNQLKKQLKDK